MDNDRFTALLDSSAPTRRPLDLTKTREMIADARTEAAPRRPLRRRTALSGVIALLLVGGAGVATASSDWLWSDGLENTDRSYTYTAPTWGQCELRFSALKTKNPLDQIAVDQIVDDWFATTDIEAAAAPLVPIFLAQREAAQSAGGEEIDPRQVDLNAWFAHDQAVGQLLSNELKAHGYDSNEGAFGYDAHSQLHCEGEDWGGEGGEL